MRLIIALVVLAALIGACASQREISPMDTPVATNIPFRHRIQTSTPDPCFTRLDPLIEQYLKGNKYPDEILQASSICKDFSLESKIEFAMTMNDSVYLERLLKH